MAKRITYRQVPCTESAGKVFHFLKPLAGMFSVPLTHGTSGSLDELLTFGLIGGFLVVLVAFVVRGNRRKDKGKDGDS